MIMTIIIIVIVIIHVLKIIIFPALKINVWETVKRMERI